MNFMLSPDLILAEKPFIYRLFFSWDGLFIVQLIHLVQTKHAKQLSLTTFVGFNIMQIIAAFYAYFHGIQALLMGMVLYLVTSVLLTILIMYYKFKNREF